VVALNKDKAIDILDFVKSDEIDDPVFRDALLSDP
jgi:non-homologous end joining protein Ku